MKRQATGPAPHVHDHTIIAWLKQTPEENEIQYKPHASGDMRRTLPYSVVKAKLDFLCPDSWDTMNFHHFFYNMPDRQRVKISGNIDLIVKYNYMLEDGTGYREVTRRLAGAASFFADEYPHNDHWAATVKSLCIVSAARELGEQFGWNLNPEEEEHKEDTFSPAIPDKAKAKVQFNGRTTQLMTPDKKIRVEYAQAVAAKDNDKVKELERIYDFGQTH